MADEQSKMYNWVPVKSEFWKPVAKDEFVVGTHSGFETTQFGDAVVLTADNGNKILLGQTVAVSKLRGLVGRLVKVVYVGEITPKKGKPYKDFEVFVQAGTAPGVVPVA